MNEEGPLQLERHLHLREKLSTVAISSLAEAIEGVPAALRSVITRKFEQAHAGPGKLSSGEFRQFGFHKDAATHAPIEEFAGKQAQQAFNKIYNDRTWYAVTKHKMLFETLMKGGKLPTTNTVAIYDRKGRGAGAELLSTQEELATFICERAKLPIFCKPTTGLLSIGAFRIDAVDDGKLLLNGTHWYRVEEVIAYMVGLSKKGYLLQEVLEPHSEFLKIDCPVIASLRFVVLNRESKASIHSCVLKVPAAHEVADNFWRSGSVLCNVDTSRGRIDRIMGMGEKGAYLVEQSSPEHDRLHGFRIPDFEQCQSVVLSAARHLAGIRVQSWDVAASVRGPVLLEVNFGGDLNLSQLASGRGIMDKSFCDTLREAGYTDQLPN